MAEVTREMLQERRQNLQKQLANAQTRLLKAEAAAERANNDTEAISGAIQELNEWERRLFGASEDG